MIVRIGFSMLQSTASESQDVGGGVPRGGDDVAFTPLAMPLLSGPGSMAVTIGMATEAERPFEYLAVAVGILGVAFATWITFKSSGAILRLFGPAGLDAMTRVMGFLLIGIGVQFVLTAIYEAALDPLIIGPLVQMIRGI